MPGYIATATQSIYFGHITERADFLSRPGRRYGNTVIPRLTSDPANECFG